MRSFSPPRLLRTAGWVVLGVWLFALGAGMANACLLEPHRAHEHGQVQDRHGAHHVHAGLVVAPDAHDHDEGPSNPPCAKVCGEAIQSPVQKSSSQTFDLAGPPVVLHPAWAAQPAASSAGPVWHRMRIAPAPQPRVLFVRLAL